jgi:hypothetical protein
MVGRLGKVSDLTHRSGAKFIPFASSFADWFNGFKQVKWIQAIEFVKDFSQIGSGQGGYAEDHEFFGRMSI